jgi:hypothetical protein
MKTYDETTTITKILVWFGLIASIVWVIAAIIYCVIINIK